MTKGSFFQQILHPPFYGFERNQQFYKPSKKELFREFLARLNPSNERGFWLSLWAWTVVVLFAPFFVLFFLNYFTWPLFAAAFVYSMILMGSHGTLYLHRYGTHRAYRVKSNWVLFLIRNLVIKVIPEEIYIVSHHVHHRYSEQPGDPYNVKGGWLYCFLADANHQVIHQTLDKNTYKKVCGLMKHTGVKLNSYEQYLRWGSLCHPLRTITHYLLNWLFWFGFFFMLGGVPLAVAIFAGAATWAVGIRTFNYEGHGKGKDRRREGIDFNTTDMSVNQVWPGYVAGEWHNNHHLYPSGARSGFLPYQIDLPWYFIKMLRMLNLVDQINDPKQEFLENYYLPYLQTKTKGQGHTTATNNTEESFNTTAAGVTVES